MSSFPVRPEDVEKWKEAIRNADTASEAFKVMLDATSRTLARMVAKQAAEYAIASEAYRKAHGRLPGSLRTKRLRKKRVTKVMRWWKKQQPKMWSGYDLAPRPDETRMWVGGYVGEPPKIWVGGHRGEPAYSVPLVRQESVLPRDVVESLPKGLPS